MGVGVRESDLRAVEGPTLTEGGQATLSWVRTSAGQCLLLKRYHDAVVADLNVASLNRAIRWRAELSGVDRERLDRIAAWPRARVLAGSATVGCLLPPAPPQFWRKDAEGTVGPRHLSELAVNTARAEQLQRDFFSSAQNVARLGTLLDNLRWLHRSGVTVGDVHPGNILTTGVRARPETYFLDCDAMLVDGQSTLPPALLPKLFGPDMRPLPTPLQPGSDMMFFAYLTAMILNRHLALGEGIPPEARQVLPSAHVALLEYLQNPPDWSFSTAPLGTVAAVWQNYVLADGREQVSTDAGWSDWREPSHVRSGPIGALDLPAGRAGRTVGERTWPALARRRTLRRWLRRSAAVVVVAALGGGYVYHSNHQHTGQPIPAVRVGPQALGSIMGAFSNVHGAIGYFPNANVMLSRRKGYLVATVTTGPARGAGRSESLAYTCPVESETQALRPAPYLVVAGSAPASGVTSAYTGWTVTASDGSHDSLYPPVCTFADGTRLAPPSAVAVPASGTSQSGVTLTFPLPGDSASSGPIAADYAYVPTALVWLAPDGYYVSAQLHRT